jgi:DNA-binding transcriptional LysR family regulator
MRIELLNTFLEVSRTLHFRVAAENLFVTQSAVRARIKLLEEDVGVFLFDRSQKQLKMTPQGNRFVKPATELVFMWQKVKQEISLVDDKKSVLAIGSMMSIWDIALQEWLNKISKNMENVSFLTQTHHQLELKKGLINGVIDIAFTFDPLVADQLVTEKVTSVPLHLVTTEPDLSDKGQKINDFISVDYGESINLQYTKTYPNAAPAKHLISQPRVALDYILSNGGSAYLPRQLVTKHINSGLLFYVDSAPIFTREIFALYPEKTHKKDIIQTTLHYFPEIIYS